MSEILEPIENTGTRDQDSYHTLATCGTIAKGGIPYESVPFIESVRKAVDGDIESENDDEEPSERSENDDDEEDNENSSNDDDEDTDDSTDDATDDDEEEEPYNEDNVIARFMGPRKYNVRYRDQISRVEDFCSDVGLTALLRDPCKQEKVWIDERSLHLNLEKRRTRKGFLTPRQLYQELLEPVCTYFRCQQYVYHQTSHGTPC